MLKEPSIGLLQHFRPNLTIYLGGIQHSGVNIDYYKKDKSSGSILTIRFEGDKDSVSIGLYTHSSRVERSFLKSFWPDNIYLVVKGRFQQVVQGTIMPRFGEYPEPHVTLVLRPSLLTWRHQLLTLYDSGNFLNVHNVGEFRKRVYLLLDKHRNCFEEV